MFYGCECSFAGRSCRDFGLMVYDFGSVGQDTSPSFASPGRAITDHIPGRNDTFLYGVDQSDQLSYTLVLTADEEAANRGNFFTRWEISEIASWLCGHQTYQYLTIRQDDMQTFRFRCIVTEMKLLHFGGVPWAFSFRVTCDSPYAYGYPETTRYTSSASSSVTVRYDNRSALNGYYSPVLTLTMRGTSASIINASDNDREMRLNDLPTSAKTIRIDCANQTIEDLSTGLNLYPYCNFTFLRLVRGDNTLVLTGNFDLDITSEFPVDIGA